VLAAAHRTLPFGTKVRVQNLSNGREVVVRVNDRGPFTGGRVIDVTRAAAEKLGMINAGVARVRVSLVDGGRELGGSCTEAAPRVLTADAAASASRKPATKPQPVAAKVEADAVPTDRQEPVAQGSVPAGDVPATAAKPADRKPGKVLVATVRYDEGDGDGGSSAVSSSAAAFADQPEDPPVDETVDLPAQDPAVALTEIPMPRPRPPVLNQPPVFDRTLALRFLDAFQPNASGFTLNVPLGYAPVAPRGAVISE
jgi:hypothetical protein